MAISFGTATRGDNFGGSTTTISASSPTVAGSNVIGYVNIVARGSAGAQTIDSATWNSVSMTLVPSSKVTSGNYSAASFYIINPPAGVSTVVGSGTNWAATAFMTINYVSGVDQTTPVDGNAVTNTGSGVTSLSTSHTLTNANEYLISVINGSAPCSIPGVGSATSDFAGCDGNATSYNSGHNGPLSAGSNSFTWTTSSSFSWVMSSFAINPDSGFTPVSGNTTQFLNILGVGI